MDTGSESILSAQNTPNSVLSSDFEEKEHENPASVLRLQDPITESPKIQNTSVLRLSEPMENNANTAETTDKFQTNCNDSLIGKMANLKIDMEVKIRPQCLGISPPKVSSTLTLTTDHPLMGLGSPDSVENYPDIIPERPKRSLLRQEEEQLKDSSISSVEESGTHLDALNFSGFYDGPQRNTSKNNLYFSENFSTIEDQSKTDNSTSPPDVTQVHNSVTRINNSVTARDSELRNRKIVSAPKDHESSTPEQISVLSDVLERKKLEFKNFGQSTPKSEISKTYDIPMNRENLHSGRPAKRSCVGCFNAPCTLVDVTVGNFLRVCLVGMNQYSIIWIEIRSGEAYSRVSGGLHAVAEWCESPSQLRSMPNFELPIEMSSTIGAHNDLDSPDISTPTDDRSSYQALLDPYSGNVALRHTPNKNNYSGGQRRKIVVMAQDTEDRCSLDSVSVESLKSEEAEVPLSVLEDQVLQQRKEDSSISDDESRRNSTSDCSEPIPEYSAAEERADTRSWLKVPLPTGGYGSCDMRVIEPYKRVLSHGGYGPASAAIIVFSACYLPDTTRADYHYVMDNLFLYVIWTLERLVTDEYMVVYLHGSASRRRLPTFRWLVECYRLVDRRLRKNLKHLYLVHPTFWLKSLMVLSKPFISSKFYRKVTYVNSLTDLESLLSVERNAIPEPVREYDAGHHRATSFFTSAFFYYAWPLTTRQLYTSPRKVATEEWRAYTAVTIPTFLRRIPL
ncbi:Protein prune homolog 2 [Eumeta japonica]|uniref:Protein prune homolog 2 n=1 Tax=Eumeta variegata TaxID=151549 RepID=A0A4C1XQ69_EUMVA|nr:Protein prune homolog 2 [Eumeta japonica]